MAETGNAAENVFLKGEMVAVDSQQIEAILRQLWQAGQHGEHGVARACMLNLVVFAGTPRNAAAAAAAVAQLTTTLLCRAIVLVSDEHSDEPPALQAWVSAHCQPAKASGQRVCCEQVTLQATGEADERLPSAVLPLLVPDLPVAVWWMGDPPFGAPIFEQLLDTADRLLVDTRSFEDPTFSLTRLAGLSRLHAGRIAISDLNWARLTPWQDQLAQSFDSVETLPYLERLERVTLHYARLSGNPRYDPEKALLLAGWLLNRIGWKMPPALARVGGGHFRGRLRRAGRDLTVEITPHDLDLPADRVDGAGMLLSVELRASLGGRAAVFRVDRRGDDLDAFVTAIMLGENEPLTSTIVRPRRTLASLLADDLSRFDHDYLFEAALETAAHLSGAAQLLPR